MKEQTIITRGELVRGLRNIGLETGRTVMLHASVKNIGWIVGGPDVVLDAILEVVGDSGTVMMLAAWEDHPYSLEEWSDEKREAYLRECPPFDPKRSRADRKGVGILAEYMRTRPGAERSSHPFSYVALGAKAHWITVHHALRYNNGPGGPLSKLCESSGAVLMLGSPLASVTLLHHAEHLADVPNKRIDHYRMPILKNGQCVWHEFEEYDISGIADWPGNYFEEIVKEYLDIGNGRSGKVGDADSHLLDAEHLKTFAAKWMEEHFK